jgi:hypothetical protein
MSAIFISHSSEDKELAREIRARLKEQKHVSVFLDFDPDRGIPAGSNWERELYRQLSSCRAVIVLCSEHSMKSQWCFAEVAYARATKKQLIPIKVTDCTIASILADTQLIDLTVDQEEGYRRLWNRLRELGLDPANVFEWDGQRSPFPGLEPFEEKDAAVFLGRENEIQSLIAELGSSLHLPDPRLFVVRGASGSGKSSLIRAGVLPRLRRDPDKWLVLEPFRPADRPFEGLALAIARAMKRDDWSAILDLLRKSADEENRILVGLALDLAPHQQGVVITIDQAEELFAPERTDVMEPFLRLLGRIAGMADGPFFVILTLRSDFLPAFEDHRELRGKPNMGIHIPPLMDDHLARIIEGPARIAGIELEPGLVQVMVTDVGAATALPFLAFVLRQLWENHKDEKQFTFQHYAALDGLKGAIGRAAENVWDYAAKEGQEESLRRVFLSMVQVGEEDQLMRRPAKLARIPQDLQKTIERFVRGRLLVTGGVEQGEPVVEVAHEAVLTGWPRLAAWIQEVRGDLRLLRQVRLAAAEWEQNANAEEFLWSEKRLVAVYQMNDRLEPEWSAAERRFAGLVEGNDLWAEIEDLGTRHHRRAQIGDRLARDGDARPGVGLRADGLPDIAWCDVPRGEIEIDERVFVVEPFQIAKYPVTWAQYSAFLQAADGHQNRGWLAGLAGHVERAGDERREVANHPADNVSWFDAVAFCRWLSARLGFEVRLPAEWEWQQAATGGQPANRYPWGEDWDARRTNTRESGLQRTTAVGMYAHGASPVGALDMCGNVYEWCLNQHERPEEIGMEHFAPKAERGGSWLWGHDYAGATVRGEDMPDIRVTDHGFRICRARADNQGQ